jgi:hypothetical protein
LVEVSKDSHEVVDAIHLRLSVDEAKELAALLYGVPVNYVTSTFGDIAHLIDEELGGTVAIYFVDENGKYGPLKEEETTGGCGCVQLYPEDSSDLEFGGPL